MQKYIYEHYDWPKFYWDEAAISLLIAEIRHRQGLLIGNLQSLGFSLRQEAVLATLTEDVLKTSEIEGEIFDRAQVRSSVASKLGLAKGGLDVSDRDSDGIIEVVLDATKNFAADLTKNRLHGWHNALFPSGRSGLHKITAGNWRTDNSGRMRVISGSMGKEKIHFIAPEAPRLEKEMSVFLDWFNSTQKLDVVAKAALAHLWFVTIHPFDDGNGRIARAIGDMALARSEKSANRFYSMSAQIRLERKRYYQILEQTQKGQLDVTEWMEWFLNCLGRAFQKSETILATVLVKSRFWDKLSGEVLNSRQKQILNIMIEDLNYKTTSSKWAKITKTSQDTAHRDIHDLVNKKILTMNKGGGRSTSYSISAAKLNKA